MLITVFANGHTTKRRHPMAEPECEVAVVMGPTKFGMSMRPEKAVRLHMDMALPGHNRTKQYNITIYRDGDYLHIDLSPIAEARALLAAWKVHAVDSYKSVKMVLDGDAGGPRGDGNRNRMRRPVLGVAIGGNTSSRCSRD
ncbi:hypothetical protein B0H13DRAFT_2332533 [Mycena leptocephala]|nr:hypothetical protein B0H13DRAFT_2332533 [Mycena leptocephala]